jgi:hypothetical protein
MATQYTTGQPVSVSADDTYTGWINFTGRRGATNSFSASLADEGSWTGTWVVEARRHWFDTDGTEHTGTTITINSATAAGVYTGQLTGQWQIRAGVTTNTTGTATVAIDH